MTQLPGQSDDDDRWLTPRTLLWALVPQLGMRRIQRDNGSALGLLRQVFVSFTSALLLVGVVVLFIIPGTESDLPVISVGAGVAAYGVVSLTLPRLFLKPLDCSSDEALLASYRTRFFLRIAFAEAAALIGFIGCFFAGSVVPYGVGLVFAAIGFSRLAPTRGNLESDEAALSIEGCGRSLIGLLRTASFPPTP